MSESRSWDKSGGKYRLLFLNNKLISPWCNLPLHLVISQPCEVIKPKQWDYQEERFQLGQKTRGFQEHYHGCLGGCQTRS